MAVEIRYMRLAKELALKANGKTSPNPLAGAVVVRNRRIVGKGFHHRAGSAHAEVLALRQAGKRAAGATLYVTLEPCSHFGRTPPCVNAIFKSKIKTVVIGMKDPNPLINGKSIRLLRSHGIMVKVGVLEKELRRINAPFIKYITRRLPYVTIKVGQSLDGKIATESGEAKWITSQRSRRLVHRLRAQYDAILVGINTVLKDDPSLSCPGKRLKKIIADSRLKLPLRARIFFKTPPEDIIVATTIYAGKDKQGALEKKGVKVIIVPGRSRLVDLKRLMRLLAQEEIANILVEGGGEINAALLRAGLVDKVSFFIAPKIIGGNRAVNSFAGQGIKKLKEAVELKNLSVKHIAGDLWVEGEVK